MRNLLKKILAAAFVLTVGTGFLFAGNHVAFQQTYPGNAVYGVDIDLMSQEVDIALWNRADFRVTIVSDYSDYPKPELSGGVLSCRDDAGGSRHKCFIEIKVPESFYAKAAYGGWSISTMSGAITASKLWGESIDIESMSGSITLSKCEAQIADITSYSGRISLSQCIFSTIVNLEATTGAIMFDGTAAGVNAETTTGSINVSLDCPATEDCTFESATGSVSVSLPENPGFKFAFDTATGSVYNAFTGYSGGKSGIDTYGSGYIIIRVETSTGSIRILRN